MQHLILKTFLVVWKFSNPNQSQDHTILDGTIFLEQRDYQFYHMVIQFTTKWIWIEKFGFFFFSLFSFDFRKR